MEFEKRCWAEVNLDRLEENLAHIRQKAPNSRVMCVVKADAYGHGDAAVATALEAAGADQFAVSGFAEAMRLRRAGVIHPVLVLGYTNPQRAGMLSANSVRQCVYSEEYARALSAAAQAAGVTVKVHIKLDTGMGRIGFAVRDDMDAAVRQIAAVTRLPGLLAEGIFTHFAVSDSAAGDDRAYTDAQYALFTEALDRLEAEGVTFMLRHCCNSGAIFTRPEMHLDMVRAGIILYGYGPSCDVPCPALQPALTVKAVISHVKRLPAGDAVSYGRTYKADTDRVVATLALGYADGYQRALSDKGVVTIHGRPAPVIGRVCMDQTMVDVTDIPGVKQGDVATIFGVGAADSLDDIAEKCGTIHYEILCDIGRRVPRVYLRGGEQIRVTDYLDGR